MVAHLVQLSIGQALLNELDQVLLNGITRRACQNTDLLFAPSLGVQTKICLILLMSIVLLAMLRCDY